MKKNIRRVFENTHPDLFGQYLYIIIVFCHDCLYRLFCFVEHQM